MAVDPPPGDNVPAPDPYPALFRQQILRSIRYVLTRLQGASSAIPDDELKAMALHVLDYALQMAVDQPEAWSLSAPALTTLAPGMEQAGHRADWADFLARGLSAALAQGDRANAGTLHFHLGTLHQLQGQMDVAEAHFVDAASAFGEMAQPRDRARAINRQAYVARLVGRNQTSADLVAQALDLLAEGDAERGYSAFVLGCNAYDGEAWKEAAAYYQQALDLWREHGETRMVAWNLTNLGTALRQMGAREAATERFEQALALFEQIEDPTNQAITRMNLGTVYLQTDRLAQAAQAYVEAEQVFRRMGDDLQLARVYNNLGLVYYAQQAWEQAEAALNSAIQTWIKIRDVPNEVNTLDTLAEVFRDSGRPEQARSTWLHALERLSTTPNAAAYPGLHRLVTKNLADLESE